jgi:hypothetical protein
MYVLVYMYIQEFLGKTYYFLFIRHGPHRKRKIGAPHEHTDGLLPSNDRKRTYRHKDGPLPSNDRERTYRHTDGPMPCNDRERTYRHTDCLLASNDRKRTHRQKGGLIRLVTKIWGYTDT